MTKKDAIENWGKTIMTKKVLESATGYLLGEVETYDQYLRGNVYGYVIEKDGDHIDSCWGYFGDDKYCKDDAKHVVDNYFKYDIKKHLKKVKQWILNKVPLDYRQSFV